MSGPSSTDHLLTQVSTQAQALWGRDLWRFLYAAVASEFVEPSALVDMIERLPQLLPCQKCQEHMKRHVAEMPPSGLNRIELLSWLSHLENSVRSQQGKPLRSLHEGLRQLELLPSPATRPVRGCNCSSRLHPASDFGRSSLSLL